MRLTDKQIGNFVRGRLALPGDERDGHRAQVGRLLDVLEGKLAEDGSYRIKKFRRAGSLEKGTSLRPRAGKPVDADVGVYFEVEDPDDFDVAELQKLIKRLLVATYPQKSEEDFKEGNRAFEIVFRASGLEIDLVPIAATDSKADYGWQHSAIGGEPVLTSIKAHLDSFRRHAALDARLASIVRAAKAWRNWQELKGIHSFILELLLCHLVEVEGPAGTLEEGLRRFFRLLARGLESPIGFDGALGTTLSGAIVIVDPANAKNNVAGRVEDGERDELVKAGTIGFETLTLAQEYEFEGETIELWKELFGPGFSIEEA